MLGGVAITGGRAGRHGKQWEFGEVTCLKATDMGYMNHVGTYYIGMRYGLLFY